MSLDFNSRSLTQDTKQIKPVGNFITRKFFGNGANDTHSDTKYVDIIVTKAGRPIAPFVSPRLGGKVIKREGKVLKTYMPPLLKPKFVTDAEEILENTATVFYADGTDPEDRAQIQLAEDLADGKDRIARRKELMAVEAVMDGKVTVKGNGVDDEIDFGRDPENTKILTGASKWTDPSSDPIADLEEWATEIFDKTGIYPNEIVMGRDAAKAFVQNEKVKEQLDNRRVEVGEIKPSKLEDGVFYVGHINELNIDIYKYVDFYDDEETGESKLIFPADKILMGNARAGGKFTHGGIVDFKAFKAAGMDINIFVGDIFVKSYENDDPSVRFLVFQAKPLPLPGEVDSYLSAKVV
jgi:hypothetical protein